MRNVIGGNGYVLGVKVFIDENVAELSAKQVGDVSSGLSLDRTVLHRGGQSRFLPLLINITPKTFGIRFDTALQAVLVGIIETIV